MARKNIFFVLSSLFVSAFLAFSLLVKKDLFVKIDFDLTVKIQDMIPRGLDRILSLVSYSARFEVMLILLLVILFLRRKIAGVAVFILFGAAHVVVYVIKEMLHQPAPPFLFFREVSTPLFRDYVKPGFSYPSGHTLRAIFVATILSYILYKSKKISSAVKLFFFLAILGYVGLVGATKVILGQHWPTDILGGALLGIGFGIASLLFLDKSEKAKHKDTV